MSYNMIVTLNNNINGGSGHVYGKFKNIYLLHFHIVVKSALTFITFVLRLIQQTVFQLITLFLP